MQASDVSKNVLLRPTDLRQYTSEVVLIQEYNRQTRECRYQGKRSVGKASDGGHRYEMLGKLGGGEGAATVVI